MHKDEFVELGKVVRSQGINGELVVELFIDIRTDIENIYIDFNDGSLDEDGSKLAYQVEKISLRKGGFAVIQFREISGRGQTGFLEGKILYVLEEDCDPEHNIKFNMNEDLSGYTLVDNKENKYLGKVIGLKLVKKSGIKKKLLIVEHENHEVPVPYESDTVNFINHTDRVVNINMPQEFLEVLLTEE